MSTYIVFKGKNPCRHLTKSEASEIVGNIFYTDKNGAEHQGEYWSLAQILEASKAMKFKPCVTDWDKYAAFNAAYADLNKVLPTEQMIISTAYDFFFADEDAPCDKVYRYFRAMDY